MIQYSNLFVFFIFSNYNIFAVFKGKKILRFSFLFAYRRFVTCEFPSPSLLLVCRSAVFKQFGAIDDDNNKTQSKVENLKSWKLQWTLWKEWPSFLARLSFRLPRPLAQDSSFPSMISIHKDKPFTIFTVQQKMHSTCVLLHASYFMHFFSTVMFNGWLLELKSHQRYECFNATFLH